MQKNLISLKHLLVKTKFRSLKPIKVSLDNLKNDHNLNNKKNMLPFDSFLFLLSNNFIDFSTSKKYFKHTIENSPNREIKLELFENLVNANTFHDSFDSFDFLIFLWNLEIDNDFTNFSINQGDKNKFTINSLEFCQKFANSFELINKFFYDVNHFDILIKTFELLESFDNFNNLNIIKSFILQQIDRQVLDKNKLPFCSFNILVNNYDIFFNFDFSGQYDLLFNLDNLSLIKNKEYYTHFNIQLDCFIFLLKHYYEFLKSDLNKNNCQIPKNFLLKKKEFQMYFFVKVALEKIEKGIIIESEITQLFSILIKILEIFKITDNHFGKNHIKNALIFFFKKILKNQKEILFAKELEVKSFQIIIDILDIEDPKLYFFLKQFFYFCLDQKVNLKTFHDEKTMLPIKFDSLIDFMFLFDIDSLDEREIWKYVNYNFFNNNLYMIKKGKFNFSKESIK